MLATALDAGGVDTSPFCEAKYGGPLRHGAASTNSTSSAAAGIFFPEYTSAYSAFFIIWVGLHMLLFNSHESALLKVIGGLIVANGITRESYSAFVAAYYSFFGVSLMIAPEVRVAAATAAQPQKRDSHALPPLPAAGLLRPVEPLRHDLLDRIR